jgi:hypothetical protein
LPPSTATRRTLAFIYRHSLDSEIGCYTAVV